MRKGIAVLLATAFAVTALPSIASAKKRHKHHRHTVVQTVDQNEANGRFVAAALHQLVVPLEVTFGPRR
jgi:hypothetical protein